MSEYLLNVYPNIQIDQPTLAAIQQYTPGWVPTAQPGYYTVCIQHLSGAIGIYEMLQVVNLYTIILRSLTDYSHLTGHVNLMINWIVSNLQQQWVPQLANEIRYRIAVYTMPLLSAPYTSWLGSWKYSRNTMLTITNQQLPEMCNEYMCRLMFNDDWTIRWATM